MQKDEAPKEAGTKRYSISMDIVIARKMDTMLGEERWDVSGYLERLVVADLKQPRFI